MGQAQINVRTRACSRTSIARTRQAALTHNVRGKELNYVSNRNISDFCVIVIDTSVIDQLKSITIKYANISHVKMESGKSIQ